ARGTWSPDQGISAQGEIDALSLRLASGWLAREVELHGALAGQFSFTQPAGQDPEGQLRLETKDAEFRYQHGEGDVDAYRWQARLDASLKAGEARAALLTNWQDYGQARASV